MPLMSQPVASLTTLPPELLFQIFDEDDLLKPADTAICRSLLPFTRMNAYRSVAAQDDITLAALGETLGAHPYLGPLVTRITVSHTAASAGVDAAWLQLSWLKAFQAMTDLEEIVIHRADLSEILDARILASAAFRSAKVLTLSSPEPIAFGDLRAIHLASSLRTLIIATPMKYQVGRPSGSFLPGLSGITHLTINAEPHSAEFTAWMEHLSLTSLDLRSGTSDLSRVIQSLGPATRRSLRNFSFGTSSYLRHHLADSFVGFDSLTHLSLWASNLDVTPEFFANLAPLPLVSVVFRGPPAEPLVRRMIDFLQSGERPTSLETLGVDVDTALWLLRGGRMGPRGEEQAKALQAVCQRCGVVLQGTIQEALKSM